MCVDLNADTHARAKLHLKTSLRHHHSSEAVKTVTRMKSILYMCIYHPLIALDSFMAVVILVNAWLIGASCDTSDWQGWIVLDISFCFLFIFEFVVKLVVMGFRDY